MKITERLLAIMRDLKGIEKSRVNMQLGYQYRGIDDVYNELHSLFAKHGVVLLPTVEKVMYKENTVERKGSPAIATRARVRVKYKFIGEEGDSMETSFTGEGIDTGDKAIYKAYSGAQKYLLLQMFLIPTEAAEPEQDSLEVIPDPEPKEHPKKQSEEAPAPAPKTIGQPQCREEKRNPLGRTASPEEPIGKVLNDIMQAPTITELQARRVRALASRTDPELRAKINKAADIRKAQLTAPKPPEEEEEKEEDNDEIIF